VLVRLYNNITAPFALAGARSGGYFLNQTGVLEAAGCYSTSYRWNKATVSLKSSIIPLISQVYINGELFYVKSNGLSLVSSLKSGRSETSG
jgi:hypothetical protein